MYSIHHKEKAAGVLMPLASLPGADGIGSFGRQSYRFIDTLAQMGIRVWQLLPLNPLGYGNSPYQPFSSYAGDEIYIDLDELVRAGLLPKGRTAYDSDTPERIDYPRVRAYKEPYLRSACHAFQANAENVPDYIAFRREAWVLPYAVFMALKKQNGLRCWNEWPQPQRDWPLEQKYDISHLQEEIDYQIFLQYIFRAQWIQLKDYAHSNGIAIMGDVPFYVGLDSADVWTGREDFLLDERCNPTHVASVPPDYFSATGQRWGNPIYNWENLQKKNFTFWINRLKYSSKLYDIIRIDHFRAFDTYWMVNAACDTAVDGRWVEAPGYAFFDTLYRQVPGIQIVAEDLGDIRPEVLTLRDHYDLMGMNIAEFSLPGNPTAQPHQLIYIGTHDNQTVLGWYRSLDRAMQTKILRVLAPYTAPREHITRKMVRFVYGSCANLAIIPIADIIGLDDCARLNTPGTVGSPNWEWKMENMTALNRHIPWVKELLQRSGRI